MKSKFTNLALISNHSQPDQAESQTRLGLLNQDCDIINSTEGITKEESFLKKSKLIVDFLKEDTLDSKVDLNTLKNIIIKNLHGDFENIGISLPYTFPVVQAYLGQKDNRHHNNILEKDVEEFINHTGIQFISPLKFEVEKLFNDKKDKDLAATPMGARGGNLDEVMSSLRINPLDSDRQSSVGNTQPSSRITPDNKPSSLGGSNQRQ